MWQWTEGRGIEPAVFFQEPVEIGPRVYEQVAVTGQLGHPETGQAVLPGSGYLTLAPQIQINL